MSKTISLLSALVIGAVGPLALHPGTASAVPVAGDLDGDLTGGAADCAPLDPSVHPGAADRPDLAFIDTNCDGIDGDKSKAIFVSTVAGNDAGTGTQNNPLKTISAGITAAATANKDVYVAGGTYAETLNLVDNVSVYGGYALGFLERSAAETTKIQGQSGPAAFAFGDTGVVLQELTLQGRPDVSGNSYGLRAVPDGASVASQVVLEHVTATADGAGGPINGFSGGTGFTGAGFGGGLGGAGGCGAGILGAFGNAGGGVGATGSTGGNGTFVAPAGATWSRQQAANGSPGAAGGGGTGGRGGVGDVNLFTNLCGGRGGTGGFGGGGGGGGGGGTAGAGSFGVYAFNSSVVAVGDTLTGGPGGAGGNGGIGGVGGFGGPGFAGAAGDCVTIFIQVCAGAGQPGLPGSRGGNGGAGGGGVGGPSAAVYQGGTSSGFTQGAGTVLASAATPAPGGLQGGTGIRAASGPTLDILRPIGAPTTSSFDFDGDGFKDPADNCPADAGDVNGCPKAPQTSIATGPAQNGYLLDTAASMGLASSKAGSTFSCSLDGGAADTCTSPHALSGLSASSHVFKAWATDGAGNADPTAASRTFTVPVNNTALTHSAGWTKKTGTGYFRNTYSTSTKKGATLSTAVSGARRVALVATKAPGQGKVNIMLGRTLLKQVNLSSTTTRKKQVFEHEFASAKSGTIKLVVATSGKPVKIEGLGVVTR